MKVSKEELRKIIREQLEDGWDDVSPDDIVDGYYNAINQLIWEEWAAAGVDPGESPEEVQYAVQALKNLIANLETGQF